MADTLIADIQALLQEAVVSELRLISIKLDGIQTQLERMVSSADTQHEAYLAERATFWKDLRSGFSPLIISGWVCLSFGDNAAKGV